MNAASPPTDPQRGGTFDPRDYPTILTTTSVYDGENRLVSIGDGDGRRPGATEDGNNGVTACTYCHVPAPPLFEFRHLEEERLFSITGPDGKPEYFRDKPTRYLVVEPDAETGELTPVVKRGRPVYLRLCREERKAR